MLRKLDLSVEHSESMKQRFNATTLVLYITKEKTLFQKDGGSALDSEIAVDEHRFLLTWENRSVKDLFPACVRKY